MSITHAVSDVKTYRTVFPIRDRKSFTGNFNTIYPVLSKFCVPSDIWRSKAESFVRLQPMLSPPLTEMNLRLRWFFVSLRQIEPKLTELIITGSNDGKLSEETLPEFPSIWSEYVKYSFNDSVVITANSIAHIFFNIPVGSYTKAQITILDQSESSPRMYWLKAFWRIIWDYYRDENLGFFAITNTSGNHSLNMASYDSFDDFFTAYLATATSPHGNGESYLESLCPSVLLRKDYFTSSSPWILKGSQPTIMSVVETPSLSWNGVGEKSIGINSAVTGFEHSGYQSLDSTGLAVTGSTVNRTNLDKNIQLFLDNVDVNSNFYLDMNRFRDMMAQTKVLERLARTGSRYTEYLKANFNIAPADETLQRAVYLGGFKQNILTNEVVQTGSDNDNPVGTLRGHGITYAENSMHSYICKEFGMLFALADVRPNLVYTQGVSREFTYKSRYEFLNPSFQNLSEQGIRKGELYYSYDTDSDGKPKNDEILGFTGMYNELRTGKEIMCGEFGNGGSMSFWNQAISFESRPSLSLEFLTGQNYNADSQRPFGVNDVTTNPIIFDFKFNSSPARPLVRNPIPKP